MTPTLHTPRLTLTAFEGRHLTDNYLGWLRDPEVVKFSELRHRTQTLERCRAYRDQLAASGHDFWAIVAADGQHIGNMTAIVDRHNAYADLSILIGDRRVWGSGLGSEAWIAVCRYLLAEGGFRKVRAGTMAVNAPMRSLMRKAGMVDDGVWRRHLLLDGVEIDVVFAALFRNGA